MNPNAFHPSLIRSVDDAVQALWAIPAAVGREEWVRVLMAAKAADVPEEDARRWSATAESYNDREFLSTWRSIKEGGIGTGTLVKIALDHGWKSTRANGHDRGAIRVARDAPARTDGGPLDGRSPVRQGVDPAAVWSRLLPAPATHPYIVAKQAQGAPLGDLRVVPDDDPRAIAGVRVAGFLVVPVRDFDGGLLSLQFIPPPGIGKKVNLPGASMAGMHVVGDLGAGAGVYVCEGIGQAWACWQATGRAAVVTFGSGRTAAVARELRARDPDARLVLVPDREKENAADTIARDVKALVARMPTGEPANFDACDFAVREGHDALAVLLEKAEPPQAGDDDQQALRAIRGGDFVRSYVAPDPILEAIPATGAGRLISITGLTGHAKTTVAALLQVCIATGRPVAGGEVVRGRVLVLCGENPDDFNAHLNATMVDLGLQPFDLDNLLVVPSRFPIEQEFDRIVEGVRQFGELTAVFVDTSAAFFFGEDDNGNVDQYTHASALRRLTTLPGRPVVFVLCHPTKSATKDNLIPRGGGSFLNEVDANLSLWKEDSGIVTLHWCGKMRGPNFDPLGFELRMVELSIRDVKGRPARSVAARFIAEDRAEQIQQREVSDEDTLLVAMLRKPDASVAELAMRCGWMSPDDKPQKSRTDRKLRGLETRKLAEQDRRGHWRLTLKGKDEANRVR